MPLTRAAAFVLFALCGCAPSFEGLVRDRHYHEAFAALGEHDRSESEHWLVARALDRDLDPALHLTIVSDADLATGIGPAAKALEGMLVVRIHYSANALTQERDEDDPVGKAALHTADQVGVGLVDGGRDVATGRTDLPGLTALTHEELPIRHAQRPFDYRTSGAYTAFWFIAGLVTLGTAQLVFDLPQPRAEQAAPPEPLPAPSDPTYLSASDLADVSRAAPNALALWYGLHPNPTRREPVPHADSFVIWKRPPREDGPITIRVGLSVGALTGLLLVYEIDLPPGQRLEERFATRFGKREQRLREIGRLARVI